MNKQIIWQIHKATHSHIQSLDNAITNHNIQVAKELPRAEITRLDFAAKDAKGTLLGGIQAYRVNWGICHIELLYIHEDYRYQGIASSLLKHVENIARDNHCYLSHLDTFDFQAKDFYLKQNYQIFGILENAPKGHNRYYMKKDL